MLRPCQVRPAWRGRLTGGYSWIKARNPLALAMGRLRITNNKTRSTWFQPDPLYVTN